MKTNNTYYAPPTVKTVEFEAENGFAASEPATTNAKTVSDWGEGNDDWFQY